MPIAASLPAPSVTARDRNAKLPGASNLPAPQRRVDGSITSRGSAADGSMTNRALRAVGLGRSASQLSKRAHPDRPEDEDVPPLIPRPADNDDDGVADVDAAVGQRIWIS